MSSKFCKKFSSYRPWFLAFVFIFICSCLKTQTSKDAEAYHDSGHAYLLKGEYGLAIKDFNKALKIAPEYKITYFNRAAAYKAKGEYGLAIKDYTKALEIDPKYPEAYNNLENLKNK